MKVLLSIKPEFVEKIISGKKKFEYRKNIFKRNDVSSVVIYATKPYGKVVGEFKIERVIVGEPKIIWRETKKDSGITSKFFNDYFEGKNLGYAIQIKDFTEYSTHLELNKFDSKIKVAPQSFCYID